ncbi:MAG: response regulator transcription factor [Dehalococcoidales bacterium]|nr:MAG: response regulator transcription factor [Dehalococcoidales bacterium]
MTESESIRVIIVDDHTVVRSGLGAVLDTSEGMELVGEAGDGEDAVKICERLQPDVILMDLQMPKMDGVEATRIIHEKWPQIHIIALTSYKEKEYVEGVLKAGATSYLLKNVSAEELVSAITKVVLDQPSLSPEAAQVLIHTVNDPSQPGTDLTDREREILSLMVDGKSNSEIAESIFITQATVKYHVSNILSKLGVTSRTEAVVIAIKNNLV